MLQASAERPLPAGGMLWVPGMSPQASDGSTPSARAREIARRRDEMLGMLRGLPESEYELSLTDLVEKATALPPSPPPTSTPSPLGMPAGQAEQQQQQPVPASASKRGSSRRRGDSGSGSGSGRSSFRSSSDGVLLNFYMPRSFTRSFTAPRPGAHAPSASFSGAARAVIVPDDSNKRERDSDTVKCWPMPWDRRWRKSSRRDTADESTAMILK